MIVKSRARGAGLGALLVVLAWPGTASAHGIAQRADLPIPAWLFAWGAALVLLVSFLALAVLWPRPVLERARERILLRVPLITEVLAGVVGVTAFAAVIYAGFAGNQTPTANLAPTMIFVIFWIGVPLLSVLFGDVFAAFSPWRAIGRATGWLIAHPGGVRLPEPLTYPAGVGRWPAAIGILLFAWVELIYVNGQDSSTLATLALFYAALMLAGMSVYGVEAWTGNADAFGVTFGLYASLSPLRWQERRLSLRPPLAGAPAMPTSAGAVALVCMMIGTTSFDGLTQGALWSGSGGLSEQLADAFGSVGLGRESAVQAGHTAGLLVAVALITGLYWMGVSGMRSVGRDHTRRELARLFAHTLIPISMAYVFAHYFSLLLFQGQALAYLVSDPLGTGADLFGTANATINYGLISSNGIWYVQVAALVIGHVAALMLAHDRALTLWPDTRTATRSQFWMLLVMVSFTCLGLWILSAAAQ